MYPGIGLQNIGAFKIRGIFPEYLFYKEKQGFFFFQLRGMLQDGKVQIPDGLGNIAFIDYRIRKIGHIGFSRDFAYRPFHHFGVDIHGPVIQDFSADGPAVMVIPGIE